MTEHPQELPPLPEPDYRRLSDLQSGIDDWYSPATMREYALASRRESPAAQWWKPIETAPEYGTQALWPQMIAALAAIDAELGLPDDGCNSTSQTLAAIRALKARAEMGQSLARTVMADQTSHDTRSVPLPAPPTESKK